MVSTSIPQQEREVGFCPSRSHVRTSGGAKGKEQKV